MKLEYHIFYALFYGRKRAEAFSIFPKTIIRRNLRRSGQSESNQKYKQIVKILK